MEKVIDKEFYLLAKDRLKKLVQGIEIEDNGKLIGWVEKPDIQAIKLVMSLHDSNKKEPEKEEKPKNDLMSKLKKM